MKDNTRGLNKRGLPAVRTIAVFRALQLGDLLCSVPAFRSLRAAYPTAHIALIGLPWAKTFVSRFSAYLDEWIAFPGFPGLPEKDPDCGALPDFLRAMQRRQVDLLIQMHGNGTLINPLIACMKAQTMAGYTSAGAYCPDWSSFMPYPDHLPEVRRHLALLEFLAVPRQGEDLEFPLWAQDFTAADRIFSAFGLSPQSYVCLHPGGRGTARRWPPERFALAADHLAALGLRIAITGTRDEQPIVQAVLRHMNGSAIDLSGQTDLGAMGALLSRSAGLVANDTGVSHLAAALRIPSVILSVGSDPHRWSPLDRALHRVLAGEQLTTDSALEEIDCLFSRDRREIRPVIHASPVAHSPSTDWLGRRL
ncbi:MAG: glycosyltransferase family 9 protein [Nitrospira sp.]